MSRKRLEAKKRHHFVWAKYLTRWGSGTKNVFYTTKTGKFAQGSVRAIAVEDYFYKITTLTSKHVEVITGISRQSPEHLHQQHMAYLTDFLMMQQAEAMYLAAGIWNQKAELHLHAMKCNLLENLHATHEEAALIVLDALANEQLDVLQNKRHMVEFMAFFGHQITRTKTFRDSAIQIQPSRNAIENEVVDAVAHAWWFLSFMFGMSIGSDLYADRHNARHAMLINDTSVPFVTSDQPVVNVHPCVSERSFDTPKYSDFYYPISPRVAYVICDSKAFTPGKQEVDETTAVELNAKAAAQAMVHIIGDTENAIRPFKKYIGRRYQRALDSRLQMV